MIPDLFFTGGKYELLFHKETGSAMQKIIRTIHFVEKVLRDNKDDESSVRVGNWGQSGKLVQ